MINIYDLQEFAPAFFKIADSSGNLIPFEFNRAQKYVNAKLEEQLKRLGYVRANILKGRQLGMSTLICCRYFHKTLVIPGTQTFILTHMGDATRSLFSMTKRLNNNLPAGLAPIAYKDNENQLLFNVNNIESGYRVGTAGSNEIGRSMTNQLLHLSEYAFYDNHASIKRGIEQTVADIAGTEKIKESTANGIANAFYFDWQAAKEGKSDYINIFVPWYWKDQNTRDAYGMELTDEERDWMTLYAADGLTARHLAWRRNKLSDFDGDYSQKCKGFSQEYPFTDEEAFINSIVDTFITVEPVKRARKAQVESTSALIIGVDPAWKGHDKTAIMRRRGRCAYKCETHQGLNNIQLATKLKTIIDNERPMKLFIDCVGYGAGAYDLLIDMGYSNVVVGINVARAANDPDKFLNLRAELWHEMREWLNQDLEVQIPDDPELQKQLCGLGYDHDRLYRMLIESKKDAKKRGMDSPDKADALMLTFAYGQHAGTTSYRPNLIPERTAGMLI